MLTTNKQLLRAIVNQNRMPEGYTQIYQGKEGCYVQVHATHGKQELADNLRIGQHLANQGERVRLLPIDSTPGTTNPDATRNDTIWEFKTPDSVSGKNGTQNALKQASAQGREKVLIELSAAYKIADVVNGLKAAFQPGRAKSIQQVDLMLPDGQTINFTADQLRNHSFINRLKKRAGSQLES
ncbi:MAG: hypothetical protein EOO61_06365 [Hymenobacter sp.]|nr:MAG: hypothetical protein EOO61_06365 [Hymenobacter sp.]